MDLDQLCQALRRYGVQSYAGPVDIDGTRMSISLTFGADDTRMSFEPMTDSKREQEEADRARHDAIALALGNHPPVPEE